MINETFVAEGDDDDDDDSEEEEEEEVEKKDDVEEEEMLKDEETENADETAFQEKDSIREEKVSTGCWFSDPCITLCSQCFLYIIPGLVTTLNFDLIHFIGTIRKLCYSQCITCIVFVSSNRVIFQTVKHL